MSTFLAWGVVLGIIGLIILALFAQVWDDAKEIGAEQQRDKDFWTVHYWKQKAQHPILLIMDTDGKESTEFILRRR